MGVEDLKLTMRRCTMCFPAIRLRLIIRLVRVLFASLVWSPSVSSSRPCVLVAVEAKVALLRLPTGTPPAAIEAIAAHMRHTSAPFVNELSAQMNKLTAFYNSQVRTFSRRLAELSSVTASGTDGHALAPTLASLRDSVSDLADAASVNATSVDKILKKHDKATRSSLRFTFVRSVLAHQPFVASVGEDLSTLRHLLATVVSRAPDGAVAATEPRSPTAATATPRLAMPSATYGAGGVGGSLPPLVSPSALHADDDGVFDTDDGTDPNAASLGLGGGSPLERWVDPQGAVETAADREVLASLTKSQSARRAPRALNNDVPAETAKRRPPRRRESLCVVLRTASNGASGAAGGSAAGPGGAPLSAGYGSSGGPTYGASAGPLVLVLRPSASAPPRLPRAVPVSGESPEEAAVRHVHEATGVACRVVARIGEFVSTSRANTVYDALRMEVADAPAGRPRAALSAATASGAPPDAAAAPIGAAARGVGAASTVGASVPSADEAESAAAAAEAEAEATAAQWDGGAKEWIALTDALSEVTDTSSMRVLNRVRERLELS